MAGIVTLKSRVLEFMEEGEVIHTATPTQETQPPKTLLNSVIQ